MMDGGFFSFCSNLCMRHSLSRCGEGKTPDEVFLCAFGHIWMFLFGEGPAVVSRFSTWHGQM